MGQIRDILTFLSLMALGAEDARYGEVHLSYLIGLFDVRHFWPYVLLGVLLLTHTLWESKIGGADILTFTALFSRYSFLEVNQMILFACLLAIAYSALKKRREVRFLPFLFCGFLFSTVMR